VAKTELFIENDEAGRVGPPDVRRGAFYAGDGTVAGGGTRGSFLPWRILDGWRGRCQHNFCPYVIG